MSDDTSGHDADVRQFAHKAMTWYGWGSPVGLGLFILAVGAFVALLHAAAVIR